MTLIRQLHTQLQAPMQSQLVRQRLPPMTTATLGRLLLLHTILRKPTTSRHLLHKHIRQPITKVGRQHSKLVRLHIMQHTLHRMSDLQQLSSTRQRGMPLATHQPLNSLLKVQITRILPQFRRSKPPRLQLVLAIMEALLLSVTAMVQLVQTTALLTLHRIRLLFKLQLLLNQKQLFTVRQCM